jgi:hypothetical protein
MDASDLLTGFIADRVGLQDSLTADDRVEFPLHDGERTRRRGRPGGADDKEQRTRRSGR